MSTIGVASSALRKARTIASVFFSVCPALSARSEEAWMAGPSAIGSVNGMPSSITSAPAAGSALRIASEVSGSGSPAVRKVTSAARPCAWSDAKRRSMRVVMLCDRLARLSRPGIAPLPPRGEADIDGADHHERNAGDQIEPFLAGDGRARRHQPHPPEIDKIGGRYHDQHPTDDFLAVDQRRLGRCFDNVIRFAARVSMIACTRTLVSSITLRTSLRSDRMIRSCSRMRFAVSSGMMFDLG